MSSLPVLLLNTVIYRGSSAFRTLLRKGVRSEWFQDPELRRAWKIICDHFAEHHSMPSPSVMTEYMPHFHLMDYADIEAETPSALLDLIREDYLQSQLYEVLEQGAALNASTPSDAAQYVRDQMHRLTSLVSPTDVIDISSESSVEDSIDEYECAGSASALGLHFPWRKLQYETLGMQPEQLIIVFGRPKSMKTFMACCVAVHAYLFSHARVLIITREMSKEMMRRRIVALLSCVPYGPWRKGALSPWDRDNVYSMLYGLVKMEKEAYSPFHSDMHPSIRIASGHSREHRGLDLVAALMDEYMPDLIIDDGFYLAAHGADSKSGPMDWRVMTALTQRAKSLASLNKIVYLVTTQANRAAVKEDIKSLHVFSYTDSFAQDCDLAIRVMKIEKNKKKGIPSYLLLGLPGYREGELDALALHAIPCVNFDELSLAEMEDYGVDENLIERATEEDNANFNKPAGPDKSCDIEEREIPLELDIEKADDIPGVPRTPVKKSVPKAPKKKGKKK